MIEDGWVVYIMSDDIVRKEWDDYLVNIICVEDKVEVV